MARLAGYRRVSRVGDRAETLISPELQARSIEGWADERGHQVEMLAAELDMSGGDDTRPILLEAIDSIERGELDGVVVWRFDRFARSLLSSLRFIERIEDAGGKLFSSSQDFDASTPSGRMARNFAMSIDQNQREEAAAGFDRAKADAIARGVWTAPFVPIGYRRAEDRTLEPDPIAAAVVVRAFAMRSAGASWAELAEMIRGALDRPWLPASARRMITNRVYLGEARQGKHVNATAQEPLVSRAVWEAAQVKHPKPARGTHGPALLGGLVRCAGCSQRATSAMTSKGRYYRCRRQHAAGRCAEPAIIAAAALDRYVEDLVLEHADTLVATISEGAALADLEAELKAAENELAFYVESVRVSEVGVEAASIGMRTRSAEVDRLRGCLGAAARAAPAVSPDVSGTLADAWPGMDLLERRHVLGGALSSVWVRKGRLALDERVLVLPAGADVGGLSVQGVRTDELLAADWIRYRDLAVTPGT